MTAPTPERRPCPHCGRDVLVRNVDRGPRGNGQGPRLVNVLRVHYPVGARHGDGQCEGSGEPVDMRPPTP